MLQEALKVATKINHDELEKLMFVDEIMNNSLSPSDYNQILSTNYVVHALLEPKINAALETNIKSALQIEDRFKLNSLKADAIESGLDTVILDETIEDLTSLEFTGANALGALYVLEGATLGGNVIQKKLRNTPGFEELGLHYYTVYQDQLMNNWVSFVQILNASGANEEDVILGAKQTFDFIASISKRLSSPTS